MLVCMYACIHVCVFGQADVYWVGRLEGRSVGRCVGWWVGKQAGQLCEHGCRVKGPETLNSKSEALQALNFFRLLDSW